MAGPIFARVPPELDFPRDETRDPRASGRSAASSRRRSAKPAPERQPFVFYEGPPTANGLPHNGHVLTRVIKDLFPRYKTMRGYDVPRKAGWDTHGLPGRGRGREGAPHPRQGRDRGVRRRAVRRRSASSRSFATRSEWEQLTERVAFWVDLDDAYVTYHKSYVESVWWALARALQEGPPLPRPQGRLVVGAGRHRALARPRSGWATRRSTTRASTSRSRWRTSPDDARSLVWTTTPWTLAVEHVRGGATRTSTTSSSTPATARSFVVAAALRRGAREEARRELADRARR